MKPSFFFYDLETSGFSPKTARIMQFAGQRTDMNLNPIGEPITTFIKLTPDVLPEPDAVMLTGITPQQTIADGISEAEFLNIFYKDIVTPGTIFVGFNNVRFDDEFIRYLNFRNFYDPYVWQWQDGRSRFDILDMVRMTRALRPEGIKWPFDKAKKPINKLEELTKINKLDHSSAHDAMSDVNATIAVAKLVKDHQPKLFDYLLSMRSKKEVAKLVETNEPFIYCSSHFPSYQLHTTVVTKLAGSNTPDSAIVYDLRIDPKPFLEMTTEELAKAWRYSDDPKAIHLPVKTLKYNRIPAIAPMGVISDEQTLKRLDIDLKKINCNHKTLKDNLGPFRDKIQAVIELLDKEREVSQVKTERIASPDEKLYDGFIAKKDEKVMAEIRSANPEDLSNFDDKLQDKRLKQLLPLYKARNYPKSLTYEEQTAWQDYCSQKLTFNKESSALARYFARIDELAGSTLDKRGEFLLEELRLYAQSLLVEIEPGYAAD